MNFINPPKKSPKNMIHRTFRSNLLGCEVGYNIYLPPDYKKSGKNYPVKYHLHGWKENESTGIWALEKTYDSKTIVVFANSCDDGYIGGELPIESMIITELLPHIDAQYRTETREKRLISGFSMGGAGAFYYAVKYPELFGSMTAYAGTYHHFYHKGSRTVDVPVEKAAEIYAEMLEKQWDTEKDGILYMVKQNAEALRRMTSITLHVGTADVLLCDNEILHLHLNALDIPHEYKIFDGIGHELAKII